jgi:hypothetical protein
MASQTRFSFRLDRAVVEALGLEPATASQAIGQTLNVSWGPHDAPASVESVAVHEDYIEVTLAIDGEQPLAVDLSDLVRPAGSGMSLHPRTGQ